MDIREQVLSGLSLSEEQREAAIDSTLALNESERQAMALLFESEVYKQITNDLDYHTLREALLRITPMPVSMVECLARKAIKLIERKSLKGSQTLMEGLEEATQIDRVSDMEKLTGPITEGTTIPADTPKASAECPECGHEMGYYGDGGKSDKDAPSGDADKLTSQGGSRGDSSQIAKKGYMDESELDESDEQIERVLRVLEKDLPPGFKANIKQVKKGEDPGEGPPDNGDKDDEKKESVEERLARLEALMAEDDKSLGNETKDPDDVPCLDKITRASVDSALNKGKGPIFDEGKKCEQDDDEPEDVEEATYNPEQLKKEMARLAQEATEGSDPTESLPEARKQKGYGDKEILADMIHGLLKAWGIKSSPNLLPSTVKIGGAPAYEVNLVTKGKEGKDKHVRLWLNMKGVIRGGVGRLAGHDVQSTLKELIAGLLQETTEEATEGSDPTEARRYPASLYGRSARPKTKKPAQKAPSPEEIARGLSDHEDTLGDAFHYPGVLAGYVFHQAHKSSYGDADWYFFPKTRLKNGNLRGLMVSQDEGDRSPGKAKQDSVDKQYAKTAHWKRLKRSQIPPKVLARFMDKGVTLKESAEETLESTLLEAKPDPKDTWEILKKTQGAQHARKQLQTFLKTAKGEDKAYFQKVLSFAGEELGAAPRKQRRNKKKPTAAQRAKQQVAWGTQAFQRGVTEAQSKRVYGDSGDVVGTVEKNPDGTWSAYDLSDFEVHKAKSMAAAMHYLHTDILRKGRKKRVHEGEVEESGAVSPQTPGTGDGKGGKVLPKVPGLGSRGKDEKSPKDKGTIGDAGLTQNESLTMQEQAAVNFLSQCGLEPGTTGWREGFRSYLQHVNQ